MTELYDPTNWLAATPQQRKAFVASVKSEVRPRRQRIKLEKERLKAVAKQSKPAKKRIVKKTEVRKLPSTPSVTSKAFLESFEWRRLRMQALIKHGRKCMCCGATPMTGAVMNVDHVKPRKFFPELALDINNLQVLCHECNHGKGNWDHTDWR